MKNKIVQSLIYVHDDNSMKQNKKHSIIVMLLIMVVILFMTFETEATTLGTIEKWSAKQTIEKTNELSILENLIGRYQFNAIGADNIQGRMLGTCTNAEQYNSKLSQLSGYEWLKDVEKDKTEYIKGNSTSCELEQKNSSDKIYKAYLIVELTEYNPESAVSELENYPITLIGPSGNGIETKVSKVCYGSRNIIRTGIIDVTEFVQKEGYGEYICCNIPYRYFSTSNDTYATWRLIVIEENVNLPVRKLVIKSGCKTIVGANSKALINLEDSHIKVKSEGTITGQLLYSIAGGDNSADIQYNSLKYSKDGTDSNIKEIVYNNDSLRTAQNPLVWSVTRNGLPLNVNTNYGIDYYSKNDFSSIITTPSEGYYKTIGRSDLELLDVDGSSNISNVFFENGATNVLLQFETLRACALMQSVLGINVDIVAPMYDCNIETTANKENITISGNATNQNIGKVNSGIYEGKIVVNVDPNIIITGVSAKFKNQEGTITTLDSSLVTIDEVNNKVVFTYGKDSSGISINREILEYTITGIATNNKEKYENSMYVSGYMLSETNEKTGLYMNNLASDTDIMEYIYIDTLFELTKTDKVTGETLSGAQFIIYKINSEKEIIDYAKDINRDYVGNKNVAGDYIVTTDESGKILLELQKGYYKIVEVEAPYGYELLANEEERTQYFEIKDSKINYIEDLVDLSNAVNSGTAYDDSMVVLSRTLDFTLDSAYKNPLDTSYGDLNGDGTIDGIKNELIKENGKGFTPIGLSKINSFKGTFNGNGFEIKNIYVNSTEKYVGLFGYVNEGNILNLGLTDGKIITNYNVSGGNAYAGGIVGILYGTIYNVYNTNSVYSHTINTSSNAYAGGIVAISYGTVSNCYNNGFISTSSDAATSSSYSAGIIGYNYGLVSECFNEANISSIVNAGGIVAHNYSDGSIINCYNIGEIYSSNNSTINTDSFAGVGGIAGVNRGNLQNSYNKGKIKVEGGTVKSRVGGILGYNYGTGIVSNCYNEGNVTNNTNNSNFSYTGGINGFNKGTVKKSYNIGIVSCTSSNSSGSGGIVGYNENTGIIIDCYNSNDIINNSVRIFNGGISGYNGGTIINCYNKGDITSVTDNDYSFTGGIEGWNCDSTANTSNCYNVGIINGNSYVGGIAGSNILVNNTTGDRIKGTISNCYYLKDVATGGISGSDITNSAESRTSTYLVSQEFTDLLNTNKEAIESNIELLDWITVSDLYPILEIEVKDVSVGEENYKYEIITIATEMPETNTLKEYTITTEVEGIGGSIAGESESPYELVTHGQNSTKEIVIIPDIGYKILSITVNGTEIEFAPNSSKNVILEQFENVQEDKKIVVKFVKDKFGYTIEYYKDTLDENNKVATTESILREYNTEMTKELITEDQGENWIDQNKPEGYKTGEVQEYITIKINENIIKVLYVKDKFDYTVEYYQDTLQNKIGTSKSIKEIYDTKITKEIIIEDLGENWIDAKKPEGYKPGVVQGYITIKTSGNVVKVLYTKDSMAYTVEYYKDTLEEVNKIATTEPVLREYNTEMTKELITEDQGENWIDQNKPEGYKPGVVQGYITIKTSGNIIKVLYVKDEFDYIIEYYQDTLDNKIGMSQSNKEIYETQITKEIIEEDLGENWLDVKKPEGYKTGAVQGYITIKTSGNIIKVLYLKDSFKYTIEYYYDGKINNEETVTGIAEYGSSINQYTNKLIEGYELDRIENKPLIIKANENANIMRVYYKKANFKYIVKYYYDEKIDEEKTKILIAEYKSIITEYEDKVKEGYKLVEKENLPLEISIDESKNIIKIYYEKIPAKVIVKHLEEETNKELTKQEIIDGYVTDEYETKRQTIYGYEATGEEPENAEGKMTQDIIEVIYYYKALPFDMAVEKYIDKIVQNGVEIEGNKENGKVVKVDIDSKNIENEDIKIQYTIKIKNNGKVAGTVGIVEDYIPEGLEFVAEDNREYWVLEGRKIETAILAEEILEPEEETELTLILRWKKSGENTGVITNLVQILEQTNKFGFKDVNNTNDTAQTQILISVKTGEKAIGYGLIIGMLSLTLMVAIIIKKKASSEI